MRVLRTDACLAADIQALIDIEPQFRVAHEATGPIALRRRDDGYASLVRTIVGQQVSVASAEAIWRRLQDAGLSQLENIAPAPIEDLKSLGLSHQKASYLKALAAADIDFDALADLSDEAVEEALTRVKGIGPWTAQIYLMFSLGRADVTAPADLALQESARLLFSLQERPSTSELAQMSQNWSPYRNAAAQLLWAYYHVMKKRDGIGL